MLCKHLVFIYSGHKVWSVILYQRKVCSLIFYFPKIFQAFQKYQEKLNSDTDYYLIIRHAEKYYCFNNHPLSTTQNVFQLHNNFQTEKSFFLYGQQNIWIIVMLSGYFLTTEKKPKKTKEVRWNSSPSLEHR